MRTGGGGMGGGCGIPQKEDLTCDFLHFNDAMRDTGRLMLSNWIH